MRKVVNVIMSSLHRSSFLRPNSANFINGGGIRRLEKQIIVFNVKKETIFFACLLDLDLRLLTLYVTGINWPLMHNYAMME